MIAQHEQSRRRLSSTSRHMASTVSPDLMSSKFHESTPRLAHSTGFGVPFFEHELPIRTQSIPIQNSGMKRTPSELQLCQDEQLADYRDYIMFSRIFDGISAKKNASKSPLGKATSELLLAHIVDTRNDNAAGQGSCATTPLDATQQHSALFPLHNVAELEQEEEDEMFPMDL